MGPLPGRTSCSNGVEGLDLSSSKEPSPALPRSKLDRGDIPLPGVIPCFDGPNMSGAVISCRFGGRQTASGPGPGNPSSAKSSLRFPSGGDAGPFLTSSLATGRFLPTSHASFGSALKI